MDELRRMRAGGATPQSAALTAPLTQGSQAAGAYTGEATTPQSAALTAPLTRGAKDTAEEAVGPVGREQLIEWTRELQKYKSGKASVEARVVAAEQWWKLRNAAQERKDAKINPNDFHSQSGWLHNVIVSKHADGMEAYPEPIILPREPMDRKEARTLTSIIPCVIEQNRFEKTYSAALWQKLKTGTGIFMVTWDNRKLNGLGDISIERVSLLNVFTEPGKDDIQESKYFFYVEPIDREELVETYPQLKDRLHGGETFQTTKFLHDDTVPTGELATVINIYYHRYPGGKKTLHYCKFVGDQVLYASENDPARAERGFYDHGLFPFVVDALFPVEGSPWGYGFIDLAQNPQTMIDLMDTAFMKNTMAGATPRYFETSNSGVNTDDLLDLTKPVVRVSGGMINDTTLKLIDYQPLHSNYINMRTEKINELRETTGNTETATGATSGVTAAAAIAAMQEASGKGSRDSSKASHRAFSEIVNLVIELIRQFYDLPRQFRITGAMGQESFVSYSNENLRMQSQTPIGGMDMGMRLPVFDIKVHAQKRDSYSRLAQNELALQFYNAGFFDPNNAQMALTVLDMMEFEGKDELMQKIARNGTLQQKLIQFQQLALTLAQKFQPELVPTLAASITGQAVMPAAGTGGISGELPSAEPEESSHMQKARAQSQQASQPE